MAGVKMIDAATIVPFDRERAAWAAWHWFWAKVFGTRVPTSADRAHIGNILVCYRPDLRSQPFTPESFHTDARRVHRLGDLYLFDYGDTPLETIVNPYPRPPREIDGLALLRDNQTHYPKEPR